MPVSEKISLYLPFIKEDVPRHNVCVRERIEPAVLKPYRKHVRIGILYDSVNGFDLVPAAVDLDGKRVAAHIVELGNGAFGIE